MLQNVFQLTNFYFGITFDKKKLLKVRETCLRDKTKDYFMIYK